MDLFERQDQTVPAASQAKLPSFKSPTLDKPSLVSSEKEESGTLRVPVKRGITEISDDEIEDATDPEPAEPPAQRRKSVADETEPEAEAEPERETPQNGLTSIISGFHERDTITRKDYVTGGVRGSTKSSLTFEQKGKVTRAFERQHSKAAPEESSEGLAEEENTQQSTEDTENVLVEPSARAVSTPPRRRPSPKPYLRPSPQPTVVKIGNRTVVSSPKRSPSKVFLSSPPVRLAKASAPKSSQSSFARKLQNFNATGAVSSSSLPEEEYDIDFDSSDVEIDPIIMEPLEEEEEEEEEEQEEQEREASLARTVAEVGSRNHETNDMSKDAENDEEEEEPESFPARIPEDQSGETIEDEEDVRERERRTVDELIARAEEGNVKSGPSIPSTMPRSDQKDTTHNMVQQIRSLSIDDIRSRSHAVYSWPSSNNKIKKGKSRAVQSSEEDPIHISTTEEPKAAEERLNLTVSKSDFQKMRIAGQFNLGFILATRASRDPNNDTEINDLFIIDQHASDEKYNFERLQAETIVQNQRLVIPKPIELSAMQEIIVFDNLPTFKKNGFEIEIDEYAETGKRVKLLTLPMSKSTVFEMKDFEELIHLIDENPSNENVRPSKVRAMFAMRACRSSIMIGKHLTTGTMEKVVKHMGELDKPWNCPHGRPTMRHLADLGEWKSWGLDQEGAFPDDNDEGVLMGGDDKMDMDGAEE